MIPAIYANIQYQLDNDEVFVANNSEVVNMFVQRTCASKCNRETGACDSRGKAISLRIIKCLQLVKMQTKSYTSSRSL